MFASGYHQRMVLAPDGSVWGMVDVGAQYFHQLGSGQSGEVKVVGLHDIASVVSGGNHSLALQSEGTVWAWGANDCGQSARSSDPRMPDTAPAAQVLLPGRAVAVAAGYRHSLSLLGDGSVWQWGNLTNPMFHANVGNQPVASFRYCGELQLPQATQALGDAHSSPIQVPGLHDIKAIATRYTHNLALAQDGSVWGWGFNDCGQAGPGRPSPVDGTTPPERIPGLADAVAIAAGRRHSLALTADGSVWTWGNNDQDQLGRDSAGLSFDERCMTRTRAPLRSAFSITPHRVAGLPPIKAIAAGDNLSLALDRQGHIWYWGQLP